MAASKVFEEDEVFVIDKKMGFRCGLVIENAEYASSDEDEEDIPMFERVKKGTVLIAWHPSGEEEVVPENNVNVPSAFPSCRCLAQLLICTDMLLIIRYLYTTYSVTNIVLASMLSEVSPMGLESRV